MSAETDNEKRTEFERKHERTKVIMARIAIAAILFFVIAACIGTALGSSGMMMASCFCLVIVPIMLYCFILVYDMVHKDDKKTAEILEKMNAEYDENRQSEEK
ncbi:MAG: hypothetical protein ACI39R_04385 [Lachnospiraceae bacterium]